MRNDIDIDFIKWMCEKTKGFHFDGTVIYQHEYNEEININIKKMSSLWFLLLQRAIEGINKLNLNGNKYPTILFDAYDLEIRYNTTSWKNKNYSFDCYETIDEIKKAALKYIYEQEKKNELF